MEGRPPSRRKSCAECVKGKRKCGMELPRCRRCSKKDITCSYPSVRLGLPSDTPIPEFPWVDDLLDASAMLPWSGELQSQISTTTNSAGSTYFDAALEGPRRTTMNRRDTEAAVKHFKTWPEKWLKEGRAPFIHPRVYDGGMPKALMDVSYI
jgi:hypothetical protein